jgi:hypothetical protein
VFVNHLCEAKGEQDGEANKAQESFAEFVISSSDSPVAFDFLAKVFYPITTPVELCGEWYSRSSIRATRNAGFNSLGARRLSKGGAIIGFVANKVESCRRQSVSSAAKEMSASFPLDKAMTIGCERALTTA